MVWVQLLNGELIGVQGNAWQMSKDVYDILEAPDKSVATLARANVIGIFKRPPRQLRQEIIDGLFEKLEQALEPFLKEDLAGAEKNEAKEKILEWFESVKADL